MLFSNIKSEVDQEYKSYLTAFGMAYHLISPSTDQKTIISIIQDIRNKFPQYTHTMPRTMAIAYYLTTGESDVFKTDKPLELINSVFKEIPDKNNRESILVDVARYYEHLTK